MTEALIGFAALIALMLTRLPIAWAMLILGLIGVAHYRGWDAAFAGMATTAYETGFAYTLSVVPLFLLMGNFITMGRLSEELYRASNAFLGHLRGGLAMATIVACGGFSAVCGSSIATAATMAKVAMPSMRRYRYADELATGTIAAGGTLGILIPPSVVMVLYGIMTQTNIGKLFIAGILPGIFSIGIYLVVIALVTRFRPQWGPRAERSDWPERLAALREVWGVALLFVGVIGGIYGGVFTPTEAAGMGAGGAFALALLRRTVSWAALYEVLAETARTTGALFMVLIGALVYSNFITLTGMPGALAAWITGLGAPSWVVIVMILLIYIALGCMVESVSMILLTVPVFFPIISALGFDPVWFGIVVVVVTEISLITPPVGMNVFVLRGMLPDVATGTIFRGVMPFFIGDMFRLTVIVAVPTLSLYLPSLMR
jgi:tripartite ATP-independent transporter DctM subunit